MLNSAVMNIGESKQVSQIDVEAPQPLLFSARARAAALALGQDFDRETVDAAGADRARVVFPIILAP